MKNFLIAFLTTSLFCSVVNAEREVIETTLIDNQGKQIGSLKITQATSGVLINLKAENLPAGPRGMHFHSVGDCSDLEKFKSAKGHVDPHTKPHGFLNEKGPHEGNLPNLIVGEDGSVEVELYSHMVNLDSGEAKLLDEDGSALIIHANKDDHNTQPIGGSGARIACGVITK